MPTSLFQYEMLPTTWFYMSSILILAVFFRFNRLFCVRNFDVLALMATSPGLVYIAMGSALQGYLWLYVVGAALFIRTAFDAFLRRRPLLAPNLNYAGLAFACAAASAFMIPNLFLNRGDACESPRAWRLEQILTAAEESDPEIGPIEERPGYLPFLRATQRVNQFFAPSQKSWRRAVLGALANKRESERNVEFFGVRFRLYHTSRDSKRPAASAVRWASGASDEYAYDLDERANGAEYFPESLNGVQAAATIPTAPIAPRAGADKETDASTPAGAGKEGDASLASSESDGEDRELNVGDSVGFRWQPLSRSGLFLVLVVVFFQIGILVSIVLIGRLHFGSLQTGFAVALLYLLLPYINQFSARLDHIVPAFAILLAVLFYRRPFVSGVALGVACSLVFYPFFLIPLWLGYYWKKGAGRFAIGASATVLTMIALLLLLIEPGDSYARAVECALGRYSIVLSQTQGLWEYIPRFYRIPIISLFGVLCFGYALWIPRKNLATLVSLSAAIMLGAQFWMGRQGGLFMAWYLPLLVLTVFRPNLEDRTATVAVVDLPGAGANLQAPQPPRED